MRPSKPISCIVLMGSALLMSSVGADAPLRTLQNNPFTRPQMLEVKPPIVKAPAAPNAVAVKLELSATMVSEVLPMVIVDGELLGLGESIRGLKLVKVMEGKAEFVSAGKKLTFTIEGNAQ